MYAPDFETAALINTRLTRYGDLSFNGRPSISLPSHDLLETILTVSEKAHLVPAHAWTPWFSLFGSIGGFDSIDECFRDVSSHIFAIETGLSSDPSMNWQCSNLDRVTMLSSSDAQSLENIGREVNRFDTDRSYEAMFAAIKTGEGFRGTYEAFPEKGKYSYDGHRKCKVCMSPAETKESNNICPVCRLPVTVGAFHRVGLLADRKEPQQPAGAADFEYIVPLPEILSELHQVNVKTKTVNTAFIKVINFAGNEFNLLKKMPLVDINAWQPRLGEAVRRMRNGQVRRTPGYDGVYGAIRVSDKDFGRPNKKQQGSLF